jgi:hypothetical protein
MIWGGKGVKGKEGSTAAFSRRKLQYGKTVGARVSILLHTPQIADK